MSDGELSTGDFDFVRNLLQERTGMLLDEDKAYLVEARLGPLVARLGLASVGELIDNVRAQPLPQHEVRLLEAMMNGETTFFRDPRFFAALQNEVLPYLLEQRQASRRLRIWSAACSTGQEPYSLSMLLDDAFPELAGWDVEITATDISEHHLKRARTGTYSQFEVNRGLPAQHLVRYFEYRPGEWTVVPRIRDRVRFRQCNLMQPWVGLPLFDLILLRNVMIYWDRATQRSVATRAGRQLMRDGCLVTGATENLLTYDIGFEQFSRTTPCCFRPTP